ncbi:MAG: hypothetical protein ACRDRJ_02955 [Streptosporangiaceae bacterium]
MRGLRWRRRRYALSARVWRIQCGRQFRWAIALPGEWRLGGLVSRFLPRHAPAWRRSRRRGGPDPGDLAGVREPRRPRPSGGAGAVELPGDPVPPGLG